MDKPPIDFTISNVVVGWVWLLGGMGVASAWLGPQIDSVRSLGFKAWLKAKTDSPVESKFIDVQAKIFVFFAVWLGLFLILDLIF